MEETQPLIVSGGGDVFEITDFTVVTDSEQFIVTIENALHEWNLAGPSPNGVKRPKSSPLPSDFVQRCNWAHDTKVITCPPTREFNLTHVWIDDPSDVEDNEMIDQYATGISDLLLPESNFYPWSIITTQFGVFEYLLLSPVIDDRDVIFMEDDLQMIQSGVYIAFLNSECVLPVFIQYGAPDRVFYVGALQDGNIRTNFETIHTHRGFQKHKCLDGLLDLMKERLNSVTLSGLDITVAIQLEYIIRNDFDYEDELNADAVYIKGHDFSVLPWGTSRDVLREFRLLTAWPGLKEEAITDTLNYSDLDPYAAPRWRASVVFHKGVKGFLYRALTKCKDGMKNNDTATVKDLVGDHGEHKTAAAAFSSVIDRGSDVKIKIVGQTLPLEKQVVVDWVAKIFKYKEDVTMTSKSPEHLGEFIQKCGDSLKLAKAAPQDCFLERLVVVLLNCLLQGESEHNQLVAVAQVWNRFVESLRLKWETNSDIPGLNSGIPDLSKCLLYQKIQMIQCCIESRRKRNELFDTTKNFTRDDEFFDANDEFLDADDSSTPLMAQTSNEPEGRLSAAEGLYLLNHPERQMYVPITQDRSPMTEDMLEEHAEYLAAMPGDDRVKAQLDTLISDMQAFKAANPGCCIEDFVRWHSPRDFVEDDDGKGRLSDRMNMDDNVWKTSWTSSSPASVAHQTRLFNESKEAEKILQMLSYIQISELFKLLMPVALVISIKKLVAEAVVCYPLIQGDLKAVVHQIVRFTQRQNYDDCLEAVNLLGKIESKIAEFKTLRNKFEIREEDMIEEDSEDDDMPAGQKPNLVDFDAFTMDLMSGNAPIQAYSNAAPEVTTAPVTILGAPNGPIAMSIRRLLHKDSRVKLDAAEHDAGISDSAELKFPPITRKHYVIRCRAPREKGSPRALPQRMAAFIDGDDFRACQSLTTDLSFC